METYNVVISERAFRGLDKVYTYLASEVMAVNVANTVDKIQSAILNLENLPKRGSERKIGIYKSKGYLQLFVGTYIIIYRVEDHKKTSCDSYNSEYEVIILDICTAPQKLDKKLLGCIYYEIKI